MVYNSEREALLRQKRSFFNIVQKAFDPPFILNMYGAIFDGLFKKRVNICCDKISRKSVEKMSNLP